VNRLAVRLRAGLLFGLFLTGTLGVPLTDAALFHLAGQDPCAGVTHIEAHGGLHHADRCSLAQPAAAQREALGSSKAIKVSPHLLLRTDALSTRAPHSAEWVTLQHSRAPPA
jgi:hypothetical protein